MTKKLLIAFFSVCMAFAVVGCDNNDGPMEEAGEEMDEAAEDMKDAFE